MKRQDFMRQIFTLLACALAFAPAITLAAPASEPFAYTTGPLTGQNGGTGFGGPWGATVTGGTINVMSPGLDQSALGYGGTGNRIQITPMSASTVLLRNLNTSFGATGTTTYLTMIAQNTNGGTRFFGTSLHDSGVERMLLGQSGSSTWLVGSGAITANSGVPSTTQSLLVAEITSQAGNDRVRLFVNPDLNLPRSVALAQATMTTLDVSTFNQIRVGAGFTAGAATTVTGSIDEIRVSTTSPFAAPTGLIAREQFDYTPTPSPLAGKNGGVGFSGAWGATAATTTANVTSPGLSYTDSVGNQLAVTGGKATLTGSSTASAASFRELSSPVQPNVSTPLWMGMIMQREDTGNTRRGFNTALFNGTETVLSFGQGNFLTGDGDNDAHPWQIANGPGTLISTATGTDTLDSSFLAVKLTYNGTDTLAELFIDPDLDTTPTSADASLILAGVQLTFDSIRPFSGGASTVPAASALFDEFRLGTSFADVAPFVAVPEPSMSLVWIAGGASVVGFALLRRVRRKGH